jgi:hypothetical protein
VNRSDSSVGEGAAFPGKLTASPTGLPFLRGFLFSSFALLLCSGCANHHFQVVAEGPPADAAHYLELSSEAQVATLHFPAGAYSFYAIDDLGYYYRAPRKILEHTSGSFISREGGIYVTKRRPQRLRGYVNMPGGLTHIGNLRRVRYDFRD